MSYSTYCNYCRAAGVKKVKLATPNMYNEHINELTSNTYNDSFKPFLVNTALVSATYLNPWQGRTTQDYLFHGLKF